MNELLQKTKLFFVRKQKTPVKESVRNPYRDWAVLFGVSFLLLIILFGLNTYLFYGIKNSSLFGVSGESVTTSRKYDHEALDKTIKDYLKKENEFGEIKKGTATITDPSK